jgi:hypothetical protein
MNAAETSRSASIVAVYSDHVSAEHAIRLLHKDGFPLDELSIIGHNIEVTEEPRGFVSTGDYVTAGARSGALLGGFTGIALGAAFLILPGIGPIVVAGPLAAAILASIEGAVAGVALGAISGALVAWGVPKEHAIKYESEVKGGKYLVIVKGNDANIARAISLLAKHRHELIGVHKSTKG